MTPELIIILGSPASGKTTLARKLGAALSIAVLGKDDIKEALFDTLGRGDRDWSRRLSEASFETLARLARRQLTDGRSLILEGNFRAAHAASLEHAVGDRGARCTQVWCRAEPAEIVRRFTSRTRHPGHLDELLPCAELEAAARLAPAFLPLDGARIVFRSDSDGDLAALLESLEKQRL
jgi:predicted kinase